MGCRRKLSHLNSGNDFESRVLGLKFFSVYPIIHAQYSCETISRKPHKVSLGFLRLMLFYMIRVRETPRDVHTILTPTVVLLANPLNDSFRSCSCFLRCPQFIKKHFKVGYCFLPVLEDFLQRSGHKSPSD